MFYPIYQLFKHKKERTLAAIFQSPRLLILQLLHTLHVYSNLHVYWFCNFCTPSTFILTSAVIREVRVSTKLRTLLEKGFHPILPYFLGLCSFANHVGKKYGRSFGKAAYVLDYLITSINMVSSKDQCWMWYLS